MSWLTTPGSNPWGGKLRQPCKLRNLSRSGSGSNRYIYSRKLKTPFPGNGLRMAPTPPVQLTEPSFWDPTGATRPASSGVLRQKINANYLLGCSFKTNSSRLIIWRDVVGRISLRAPSAMGPWSQGFTCAWAALSLKKFGFRSLLGKTWHYHSRSTRRASLA